MHGYWKSGGASVAPALFSNEKIDMRKFPLNATSKITPNDYFDDLSLMQLLPNLTGDVVAARFWKYSIESEDAVIKILQGVPINSNGEIPAMQYWNYGIPDEMGNLQGSVNGCVDDYLAGRGPMEDWVIPYLNRLATIFGEYGFIPKSGGSYTMKLNTRYVGYSGGGTNSWVNLPLRTPTFNESYWTPNLTLPSLSDFNFLITNPLELQEEHYLADPGVYSVSIISTRAGGPFLPNNASFEYMGGINGNLFDPRVQPNHLQSTDGTVPGLMKLEAKKV